MPSYEEIRDVAIDILLGRETISYEANQWGNLRLGIAEVFARRAGRTVERRGFQDLSPDDAELAREAFWDLFRQGFIILGLNDNNPGWPWFRLTRLGRTALEQGQPYRFADATSYLAMVRSHVPAIDGVTTMYLDEAVQAFYAGCMLAACVMLGVAAENRFLMLLDAIDGNAAADRRFHRLGREPTILRKIERFWAVITSVIGTFPSDLREDLHTQFLGIQSLIRVSRNEAGHPTGTRMQREQVYIRLQLFAPMAQKLEQLRQHLAP